MRLSTYPARHAALATGIGYCYNSRMVTSDPSGADPIAEEAPQQEASPAESSALALPPPPQAPLPEPSGAPHIHQYINVHVEETPDSLLVRRTETILAHRHSSEPPIGADGDHRLPSLPPRRGRGRRESGGPGGAAEHGAGEFITFGSKSRIPAHLTRGQLDTYLLQERRIALDARDPIAISYAAERYNTIMALLQESSEGETIDLLKPMLSVSQAAKILGYNAKEVRRLLGQGKISGRKVGSEWRIPLRAVL